jgi:hypothetical protein
MDARLGVILSGKGGEVDWAVYDRIDAAQGLSRPLEVELLEKIRCGIITKVEAELRRHPRNECLDLTQPLYAAPKKGGLQMELITTLAELQMCVNKVSSNSSKHDGFAAVLAVGFPAHQQHVNARRGVSHVVDPVGSPSSSNEIDLFSEVGAVDVDLLATSAPIGFKGTVKPVPIFEGRSARGRGGGGDGGVAGAAVQSDGDKGILLYASVSPWPWPLLCVS